MITSVAHVQAMAGYELADLGATPGVSLAQNESAYPPSPMAIAAGQNALAAAPLYPDPDWTDLREAIGQVHQLDPGLILCGAGSMELIGCLIRAFAGQGDEVLGTEYGYLFLRTAVQQAQADYAQAIEGQMTVSVDALLAAVTPRTRIVFLCNPGNPTGTCIPNSEIPRLRDALPGTVLLVIDQAYGEFDSQDPTAIFKLVERGDTVVLRTLSKAYGLAGARVGWGLFPPAISAEVRKLINPNNISAISQAMAAAAIRDQSYMQTVVDRTAESRRKFSTSLRAIGLLTPKSHTNFVLIPFRDATLAVAADEALRSAGLLARRMDGYALPHCLRSTIAAPKEMDRALWTLAKFQESLHAS